MDTSDVMTGKRYVSLEVLDFSGSEWLGSDISDPQSAYRTSSNPQREALRRMLRAEDGSGVVTDLLRATRTGSVPSFVGREAREAREAVREAFKVTSRETADALPPEHGSGERSSITRSQDTSVTYAGPIAATGPVNVFAVDSHGVTERSTVIQSRVYVDRTKLRNDVREHEVTYLPLTVAQATEPAAFWSFGTGWRADRGTTSADAFGLRRRPDVGEHSDPLPAVLKPSSRKRKRDGRMGGSAILTHR